MGDQHRFGALQMGVGGHRRVARGFGLLDQLPAPSPQDEPAIGLHLLPHVQPQVGGNLLVAAAAGVQLQAEIADALHQLQLHKVVNVFRFRAARRCRCGRPRA